MVERRGASFARMADFMSSVTRSFNGLAMFHILWKNKQRSPQRRPARAS
jgi:hypothetical protein